MGNEKENIYDDQYWYEKAKKDYAAPEPRYEDQDKEYGNYVISNTKNLVDLTGHWFVNFGVDLPEATIEGSRILTLNGGFDPDIFIDVLTAKIQDTLPQNARDIITKSGQRIIIRAFNRIDNPSLVAIGRSST